MLYSPAPHCDPLPTWLLCIRPACLPCLVSPPCLILLLVTFAPVLRSPRKPPRAAVETSRPRRGERARRSLLDPYEDAGVYDSLDEAKLMQADTTTFLNVVHEHAENMQVVVVEENIKLATPSSNALQHRPIEHRLQRWWLDLAPSHRQNLYEEMLKVLLSSSYLPIQVTIMPQSLDHASEIALTLVPEISETCFNPLRLSKLFQEIVSPWMMYTSLLALFLPSPQVPSTPPRRSCPVLSCPSHPRPFSLSRSLPHSCPHSKPPKVKRAALIMGRDLSAARSRSVPTEQSRAVDLRICSQPSSSHESRMQRADQAISRAKTVLALREISHIIGECRARDRSLSIRADPRCSKMRRGPARMRWRLHLTCRVERRTSAAETNFSSGANPKVRRAR